jgi:hypothetical protein
VYRTYYWPQKFPARQIVKVRHEYTPVIGFKSFEQKTLAPLVKDACIEAPLAHKLVTLWTKGPADGAPYGWAINADWVKYILTTANNWKTPIKDFELILELPGKADHGETFVSLCWDGKFTHPDKTHFVAKETNFVPKSDLAVYYLRVGAEGWSWPDSK